MADLGELGASETLQTKRFKFCNADFAILKRVLAKIPN